MKKLLSIIVMALCTPTISVQEINPKVFNRAFELLCDTTAKSIAENEKFNAYFKKHTETLNIEVIQVIEDSDSVSYCLVEAKGDSEIDYDVAFFETINEVVYDGKKSKMSNVFWQELILMNRKAWGKKLYHII